MYFNRRKKWGEVRHLPTLNFFYRLKPEEEVLIEITGQSVQVVHSHHCNPNLFHKTWNKDLPTSNFQRFTRWHRFVTLFPVLTLNTIL